MPQRIRSFFRRVLITLALFFVACAGGLAILLFSGPTWHVQAYQHEIDAGTRAIEASRTDTARAAGYLRRGRGYAEIARYRHVMRSIDAGEYVRLYQRAMQDLDAAVRLDPANVEALNARGVINFEHSSTATENRFESADAIKILLVRAKADFTVVIDRDPRNRIALDYRGMTNEMQGDYGAAIDDYTRVAALDATLGRLRLADLYCRRGGTWIRTKQFDNAVADLELSIALVTDADSCECDPYSPLLWTYFEGLGDFDKSWALVHKAQSNRRWLMPELVAKLTAASPQNR